MAARWLLIFTVLHCHLFSICSSHRPYRALYPVKQRVRRGAEALSNPVFQRSVKDVDLLFEILHSGLDFPNDDPHRHHHDSFQVRDRELASLRRTRALEVICEDILPRTLSEIRRLTSALAQHVNASVLRQEDFERTLLTMVYTARHVAHAASHHQRGLWAESLVELYRVVKRDLADK
ncbi:protein FAM180A-like [Engraulis encrasicolus]|uniref:protein FAM180A-like n=1 Tax=Engraulis encrasicolus TaxID=184585 RepID=UPI002FD22700